jgi:Cu(I)/Ag(I) efflux system membrane fusion protein
MNRTDRDWMKKTAAAACLAALPLLAAACGGRPAGEPAATTAAGDLRWRVWLDPNPPAEKSNALWVEILDAAGEPVEGAEVGLDYLMPAMGAMAEMRGTGQVAERGEGLYRIAVDFPMRGTWGLDLTIAAERARASGEYSLTTGSRGLRQTGDEGGARGAPAARGEAVTVAVKVAPIELPEAALEALRTALAAYEEARALLASGRVEGLEPRAARLAAAIEAAVQALPGEGPSEASRCLDQAAAAARSLGAARDLDAARTAFGEVSRFLIALAGADRRLAPEWHVFECPMTKTFPKWMQPHEELENPYMGPEMATCGTESDWTVTAPVTPAQLEGHAEHAHGGDVAYYTCSMHTSVKSETEGTCPLCSMNLVPVTEEEVSTGIIRVDSARRQTIGVTTARAERRAVERSIRAVGRVVYDQTRLADVNVKYRGWIGRLQVDEPGQYVRRGQTLFTLYSPELYATQQEYLTALESQRAAGRTAIPDRADYLVEASRQRLRLWDLQDAQIDRLAATGEPLKYLPITSPVSGYVIEKDVVEGASVEPGIRLFRIAGLDSVWVEAEVYEAELPLIEVGQPAEVTLSYLPGRRFDGRVAFVYPYLQGATRTGTVRVRLANPDLVLKPEMYANVVIRLDLGERLVVPEQAVLYAGERSFVFVDLGEGRLKPTAVETGFKTGDEIEILSGLSAGDPVVTSGNFLIAAESRLKLAMEQWQ